MELLILKELEEKIKKLAREHALLKEKNIELEELLKNKTLELKELNTKTEELLRNKALELEELNTKIKEYDEERVEIRTKVDSLLEMLSDVSVHE